MRGTVGQGMIPKHGGCRVVRRSHLCTARHTKGWLHPQVAGCDGSHSSQSCTLEVLVCARYRGPGLVPLARWVPGGTQVAPVYCQAYQGLYAPSGCTWGHHVLLWSGGHVQFSTLLRRHAGRTCVAWRCGWSLQQAGLAGVLCRMDVAPFPGPATPHDDLGFLVLVFLFSWAVFLGCCRPLFFWFSLCAVSVRKGLQPYRLRRWRKF